jgi:hypothetical protein
VAGFAAQDADGGDLVVLYGIFGSTTCSLSQRFATRTRSIAGDERAAGPRRSEGAHVHCGYLRRGGTESDGGHNAA